jgi:rhodanese-related sulfurtransferase
VSPLEHLQEDLTPEQAAELAAKGEVRLVDVRETYEWDEGRIAGALHVEMDQLSAEAGALSGDPPVVFYCRVGSRSAVATQAFRASGLEAYNLAGGILGWVEKGLPIEPEDGAVAPH